MSTPRSTVWVLLVAIVGSGMAFVDSSAVNVALPSIARDLRADAAALQWVVEGYALFLSALILVGGSLGDGYGRRRIFLIGIGVFAAASAVCAAAPTIAILNAARCVQGVGGALATPGSLALISASFDIEARGKAIGTWSGFASITAAIGPLLGGWLAQHASWRFVFLINVPLGLFVIAAGIRFVPESREDGGTQSIDVAGAALATAALGSLTFGLIRLQTDIRDGLGLACVAGGCLLLGLFVVCEMRVGHPMVPLHIFRNVMFSATNLYTFFLYAALGGSLYFVPFDLQNVHGYSPTAAGAAMLPFIVIMFVFARWSGGLVARVGARLPLIAGAIVAGLGFVGYARTGVGGSYWTTFFPAAVILGAGGALFVAPLTTAVMGALDTNEAGLASGINNAVSRIAGLLAIAAFGIVVGSTFFAGFDQRMDAITLSASAQRTLERERAALSTGRPITGVPGPAGERIDTAIAAAYTSAFERVMLLSALISWIAAAIAWRALPAAVRPTPSTTG